jgi:hypothetical protein
VQQWPKVEGIYTGIAPICETFKQFVQDCKQNLGSIGFVKSSDGATNQNLNKLDQTFMYTQIMKEILLIIDFQQKHIDEFLTCCREQCVYPSFLYFMLNRALGIMEVDLIIKLEFFVRDLHEHIAAPHSEQDDEHHHLYSLSRFFLANLVY